jgi:UDP:flavonoid glycosyltransferase YjiC (YdhE family)
MGSTGPLSAMKAVLERLSSLSMRAQVICTTATQDIGALPEGCFQVPFASGSRLCEVADVVVCHGGNGTIYQALSRGKPIVGAPAFHDQDFNMQQVRNLGLGLMARTGRRLAESIEQGVEKILSDYGAYEGRCREFRDRFLVSCDGARNAAREIAQYCAAPGAPGRPAAT